MTEAPHDPAIRIELLAVAIGRSHDALEMWSRDGRIPQRDLMVNRRIRAWKLSTIRAWDPAVGRRLDLLLIALK